MTNERISDERLKEILSEYRKFIQPSQHWLTPTGQQMAHDIVAAMQELHELRVTHEPSESPQAPIAKIIVRESGAGHYAPDDVYVKLYAPGLPPGEHDVYCEPMSVAPALGASRDASSTGSSLPPTQHVAGGWGYSCTEAVRCSHGKVDGECLVIPCAHYGQKT